MSPHTSDSSWLQPMKPSAVRGRPDSGEGRHQQQHGAHDACCQMKLSSTATRQASVLLQTSTT